MHAYAYAASASGAGQTVSVKSNILSFSNSCHKTMHHQMDTVVSPLPHTISWKDMIIGHSSQLSQCTAGSAWQSL